MTTDDTRPALGYVEIVKPDASPRDMEAIRERLPEVQEAIAAGKLVFVVEGVTLRWHPFGIDAERARHAALVAAARAVVDTAVVGGGWLLDDDLYPALDALEAVLASEEARNGNG